MMNQKIKDAYDSIKPQEKIQKRILCNLLAYCRTLEEKEGKSMRRRSVGRMWSVGVVVAVLVACMTIGGVATYTKWSLPAPTTFEVSPDNGVYEIHSTADYSSEDIPTSIVPLTETTQAPSDVELIQKALDVLNKIGVTEVTVNEMKVVRKRDNLKQLEEAEVCFLDPDIDASVTFLASNGRLIGINCMSYDRLHTVDVADDRKPEEVADYFYSLLPVEQGYKRTSCEKYDDNFWSYDFCRQVTEDIYSYYESVRIMVNPQTKRLNFLNVFYFPLLDDHEEGDKPLTEEEAIQVLAQSENTDFLVKEGTPYVLEKAEVCICLPNWIFTAQASADAAYSQVTRLAWSLKYRENESRIQSSVVVYVDYYTGEVLGGDAT